MSTNPTSFRFPFKMPPDIHPQVDLAIRNTYNGLLDVNQAIAALNTKVAGISAGASTVIQNTTIAGGGVSLPTFGLVNPQPNQTPDAYILQQSDLAGLVLVNDVNPFALTLNSGLTIPFFCVVWNFGTGTITATPSANQVNNTASVTLTTGQFGIFYMDNTLNWWAIIR